MSAAILDVDIRVEFRDRGAVLNGFRLEVQPGEIFGLAGPSGCGKSTFALTVLRLLDPYRAKVTGRVRFGNRDLLRLPEKTMRAIRGKEIGLVLQSPLAALNPRLRIGTHLCEAWRAHAPRSVDWSDRVRSTLEDVSLPSDDSFLRRFPKELSVGMAQRVLIAMAVLHRPKLVIADEATSALDVITQGGALELFRSLNRTLGVSILFITHDLLAAASLCDRIGIVHEGRLVEAGATRQIFDHPQHPYTRKLISALPSLQTPSNGLFRLGQGLDALAEHPAALDSGAGQNNPVSPYVNT